MDMSNGLAGFDFQALNRRALASAEPLNLAADYGVSIVRARSIAAYRCMLTYHLTKDENAGRHNIFVEVLDEQGRRDKSPMLNWTVSLDRPPQTKALDKPDNEPAADIPLSAQDTVTLRINDGTPNGDSDSVGGLHFRHFSDGDYGHHSYYIVFGKQSALTPPIEPPTPVEPVLTLESLAERVAALERRLNEMEGD